MEIWRFSPVPLILVAGMWIRNACPISCFTFSPAFLINAGVNGEIYCNLEVICLFVVSCSSAFAFVRWVFRWKNEGYKNVTNTWRPVHPLRYAMQCQHTVIFYCFTNCSSTSHTAYDVACDILRSTPRKCELKKRCQNINKFTMQCSRTRNLFLMHLRRLELLYHVRIKRGIFYEKTRSYKARRWVALCSIH